VTSCSRSVMLFFHVYGDHRALHSFPTRRSSDLLAGIGGQSERTKRSCVRRLNGRSWSLLEAKDREAADFMPKRLIFMNHLLKCRSEEHTSELQSRENLVCRLLLEKKKKKKEERP